MRPLRIALIALGGLVLAAGLGVLVFLVYARIVDQTHPFPPGSGTRTDTTRLPSKGQTYVGDDTLWTVAPVHVSVQVTRVVRTGRSAHGEMHLSAHATALGINLGSTDGICSWTIHEDNSVSLSETKGATKPFDPFTFISRDHFRLVYYPDSDSLMLQCQPNRDIIPKVVRGFIEAANPVVQATLRTHPSHRPPEHAS